MPKIVFSAKSVCVDVCVCVRPSGYEKNKARIINQISPTTFQFAYMALAINITDGCGLSNEAYLVTVEEEQGYAVFAIFCSKSPLTSYTLLTIQSTSVLKVGMPSTL